MLIFICTGNTCRSPMAEVIAKDIFAKENISLSVLSRGVSTEAGLISTNDAKEAVKKYGLSLDDHRSSPITQSDIDNSTLILTMTQSHKKIILQKFKNAEKKTMTIYEYVYETKKDVEDPYFRGLDVYKKCAEEIHGLILGVVKKLSIVEGEGQK